MSSLERHPSGRFLLAYTQLWRDGSKRPRIFDGLTNAEDLITPLIRNLNIGHSSKA